MLAENVWSNEKKIELVKTVFGQITRFKNSLSIYRVMQGANVCYADATNALQLVKNNVDMAIALLVTEGPAENTGEETEKDLKLSIQDIRNRYMPLPISFIMTCINTFLQSFGSTKAYGTVCFADMGASQAE